MIRSTFFGLEIGRTGLTVSQIGLDVTSHNIANVDTAGYTRQRLISTAYDPFTTIGRALPASQANIGGGVRVKILDQIRSAYLDKRFRSENTTNSYWMKRTEGLTYLESYFDNVNEETSINYSIAEFFRAVKVIAQDPVESAQRTLLKTAGMDLVQQFNSIYQGLVDLQDTQDQAVKVIVDDVNRIANEITELNKIIYGYELTGLVANDLRDKRNLLLDDLSSLVDISYEEYSDGMGNTMLKVMLCGEELVNHDKSYELEVVKGDNKIPGEAQVWVPRWKTRPDSENYVSSVYLGEKNELVNLPGIDLYDVKAVEARVSKINSLADQFNHLNVQYVEDSVGTPYFSGIHATEAQEILDQLKTLVDNADFYECYLGGEHAVLTINGITFARSAGCVDEHVPTPNVRFTVTQSPPSETPLNPLEFKGGELKAYLDMRDGDGVNNSVKGIPYYIEMINNLVRAIVQEVNKIHRAGWSDDAIELSRTNLDFFGIVDDNGNYIKPITYWALASDTSAMPAELYKDPVTGQYLDGPGGDVIDLSAVDPGTGEPLYKYCIIQEPSITAKNVRISEDVMNSVYNIACSAVQVVRHGLPTELQSGNNENMNALYKLFEKKDIALGNLAAGGVSIGSLDGYATTIRFDVGNTLNFAKKTAENSTVLTLAAENQRLSVSGVSLDEEMINMVKYQHAYNGAARVITVMDELLDKLINGTGRVGL